MKAPARAMSESILHKARWPWPGRCAVCGAWGWLKAWDEGLQGRFCTGCFDHVVAAEAVLAGQGLVSSVCAAAAHRQRRADTDAWRHWMELGALWVLWGSGVAWPPPEGPLSPKRRHARGKEPSDGPVQEP